MVFMRVMWSLLAVLLPLTPHSAACGASDTKVSGTHKPSRVCSGQLIFEDRFSSFRHDIWKHENTLGGGGLNNNEFQYYSNNRTNSFVKGGLLQLRPSLTADHFGLPFLTNGTLNLDGGTPGSRCTNSKWRGCERTGTNDSIINPIKSAYISTVDSFSFRYGLIEIRAKLAVGDWLWPAIRLLPTFNAYGAWPASGEIKLAECRGNRIMFSNGVFIGNREASSTLIFIPYPDTLACNDCFRYSTRNVPSFNSSRFHRYQLDWRPGSIKFGIDDHEMGRVTLSNSGFWRVGRYSRMQNVLNPWQYGTKMAPFDQKFHIALNLAVGGTSGYFPEGASNPDPKPWNNSDPSVAARDFWDARDNWLKTWNLNANEGKDASIQVDYVRVWAL